jgi:hypothetical protein
MGLLLVLGWHYVPGFFDNRGGIDGIGRSNSQDRPSLAGLYLVDPKLEALEAQASQYEPGRNIFGYVSKPPPTPPKPPPPKPPAQVVRQPTPPPPRQTGPTPPTVTATLLGLFGPEKRRIAVLVDGTVLLNVVEEDVIDNKFIVHHIGFESVDLTFVGFPDVESHRLVIGD